MKNDKAAYEKIVIGPLVIAGEMLTLGHYMESLKITKQATKQSYPNTMKFYWKNYGMGGFYRGFYPWGLIQTTKGLPVLFVQHEMKKILNDNDIGKESYRNIYAGITAGIVQGFFVTPTQRLKTMVMTNDNITDKTKKINSTYILKQSIKKEGISTLFRGLAPMCFKRGADWAVRFGTAGVIKDKIVDYRGYESKKDLTFIDNVLSGLGAGIVGASTTPMDNVVANCQKFGADKNKGALTVASEMYRGGGVRPFFNGLMMRVIHTGYHTAWVIGVGGWLFNLYETNYKNN